VLAKEKRKVNLQWKQEKNYIVEKTEEREIIEEILNVSRV
jgi:hypothetical protein